LAALQLVLLIPVVVWLGRLTRIEKWPRRWTGIALAASIAAVVLQLLLLTGALPFAIQFGLMSVCIVLLYCWAWVVGGLPGALVWLAFPLWVLLVAHDAAWGAIR
jgi:hypothetical protein